MNIRQLRYFVAVADAGSITAASKVLNITQPALSRQIRAFEDDCGWNLLDRGAKSIRLTRAGEVVLREGREIIKEVDRRKLIMQRQIDGGVIKVGYAPVLGGPLIKMAIGCFLQRHARVQVELLDLTSQDMREKAIAGEIDLFVGSQSSEKELNWRTLVIKRCCLAVPAGHEFADREIIRGEELDGQRMLILSRVEYKDYQKLITNYFLDHGANAKIAGEFDGMMSLRVALEAGLGLAILPYETEADDSVRLIPLSPEPKPIKVAAAWSSARQPGPVVSAFVEELYHAGQRV
ncbi:LysR family transcriptional regulator [Persicirhabdus sediminis]|uniref:LysR family transcriptional regulator n=1 Tax=Persicirhabdus sediminis TaxID=454144 RepID=A0A8J7MFE3_9BACT|nr:LysR family transcriptional regulator [Persicirhabdus sediminis]MBK1791693.1 LysR family transcriptional regulator [Persicirhabdus sediminis]